MHLQNLSKNDEFFIHFLSAGSNARKPGKLKQKRKKDSVLSNTAFDFFQNENFLKSTPTQLFGLAHMPSSFVQMSNVSLWHESWFKVPDLFCNS